MSTQSSTHIEHSPTRDSFEYRHTVTFGDTNIVGNVYFTNYFVWQGKCRELGLHAAGYTEIEADLNRGFGFATQSAHIDYVEEARLYDEVLVRMTLRNLTRSVIEFDFAYYRASDMAQLATGRQAVVWVNQQHHPSLMPDDLHAATATYFGWDGDGKA